MHFAMETVITKRFPRLFLLITASLLSSSSFSPTVSLTRHSRQNEVSCRITASSILTSVEFFDGSQIANPVVVSNVFWSNLQSGIVSFAMGQLVATAIFISILLAFSSQFTNILTFVNNEILKQPQPIKVPERLRVNGDRKVPPPDFTKLLVCLAIDIIGSSSELIPVVGELSDVLWAPIAALLLRRLFGNNNVLAILEFAEEILPLTDILPLATLCWAVDAFWGETDLAKVLGLGAYRPATGEIVDVITVSSEEGPQKRLAGSKEKSD